jgi:hypothetical protein
MDNSRLFADFIKDFLADKLPVLRDVKLVFRKGKPTVFFA